MAFGWFSKGKDSQEKTLVKARKLASQGRWAEALSFFQEARENDEANEEAKSGIRACRERLVACNLEEAEAYRSTEPAKAREHARLALELAGGDEELATTARVALESLKGGEEPARPKAAEAPKPLFAGSCSCATPCQVPGEELEEAYEIDVEDLAAFYLESCEPAEREALEPLGNSFREGFVFLQQGQLTDAKPLLARAALEEPGAPGVHYALGLLASLEGDREAAGVHFLDALRVAPDFAPAARHRAEVLREAGQTAKAFEFLTAWLSSHPEDGEGHLLAAACLLDSGDLTGASRHAAESLRFCVAEDPRPALLMAQAYRREGDIDRALQALQGVLSRRPDLLDALVPWGQLLLEQGGAHAERAAEAFKRCYQLDPDHGWWYLLRVAEAYAARGWASEAVQILERAKSELPEPEEAAKEWERVNAALRGE